MVAFFSFQSFATLSHCIVSPKNNVKIYNFNGYDLSTAAAAASTAKIVVVTTDSTADLMCACVCEVKFSVEQKEFMKFCIILCNNPLILLI